MSFIVGLITLTSGLIAWLGQSLAFLAPSIAVSLGVLEPEEELDATLYVVEARAMGLSDMLMGWMLPLSALLMIVGHPAWPYLALIGAGVFIYFSAVIILNRIYLKRGGKRVGRRASEVAAYVFGAIWIACSLAMIGLAAVELSS
jgi:hypothetical protein